MFSLHNLLIKHFVCQNYDRGLNKPVYLIKPFLQFGYCNMYDITQFLPFFNLVAFYVVFDIPFNTCSPGRQRFEIAICCPQGNGSLRIVSLNSHHVVPKLPESEGCPKVLPNLTQNYLKEGSNLCLYFVKVFSEMSQSCVKWSLLMLPCCHEICRGSVFKLAVVVRIPLYNILLLLLRYASTLL